MRAHSKIWISLAVSLAISAVMAYLAFNIVREMSGDFSRYQSYSQIINETFALDILIDDALKAEAKGRNRQQIGQVSGTLSQMLESISPSNPREEFLIRQIRRHNLELGPLIDQLFEPPAGSNGSIETERRNLLASQLWVKVRFITDDVNRLMETSGTRIVAAQAKTGIIVLILIGVAILSNAAIYFFSSRSMVRAQEALQESQRQAALLADLLESSSQPFGIGFPDGSMGMCNTAFHQLLGYSKEEFSALNWGKDLTPPQWLEQEAVILQELNRTGQPVRYEKEYRRQDGTCVPVELLVHLRRNGLGEPSYYYAFITDITERKQAEQKINYLASFPMINPNPILEVDEKGRILFSNPSARRVAENLSLPEGVKAFVPPELEERFKAARQGEKRDYLVDVSLADHFYSISVFFPPDQLTARLYALDITERRRAELERQQLLGQLQQNEEELQAQNEELQAQTQELQVQTEELRAANLKVLQAHEALRESREDLNRAQAVAHTGSWRMDVQRNVLSWSDENHRIFGLPPGLPLTYETFLNTVHPEDRDYVNNKWMAALRGEPYDIEHRLVVGDGVKWVREQAELEFDQHGCLLGGFGTTQDITDRKRAEEERLKLIEQLQQSEEELQVSNEELVVQAEELQTNEEKLLWSNQRLDLLAETASLLLASVTPQQIVDSLCWKIMKLLDCDVFFNFLRDEQEDKLHLNAYAGIPPEEARRIEWLDYGVAVCGCAARDGCRIVAEDIFHTPDLRTELVKSYGIQVYACHPLLAQDRILGTLSFGARNRTRFTEEELGLMKAVTDQVAIALERQQAEACIKASLREKEVLLREIHHRTKNNLNVVCALLSLQSAQHNNDVIQFAFQEMENRIRSMALVHEKLYQARDLSNIDLGEYLQDLAVSVMGDYQLGKEKIALILQFANLKVNIETAMPCGLIINELVSNAMKYAFPEERAGTIRITLQPAADGYIELRVADDGVGLPPDLDIRNTESLGMQLITNLAEHQLQGELELYLDQGTEFRLRFREQEYTQRI